MRFVKAFPDPDRPIIRWALWANNLEELTAMGDVNNPLILPENEVPENIYGVCPLKFDNGILVARDEIEMETYQVVFEQKSAILTAAESIQTIGSDKFTYGSNDYPMHQAAQLRYAAVAASPKGIDMMNVKGEIVHIASANLSAFLNAYYDKIIEITNYTIA
ncbi:hypothetical protein FNO01nite_30610 [Flavobacterium noncentrifugens]|uniref:Uncharacterized protein n=1 Tax=Flavobacterium noncentrifugens TaxID=1128970 RepID=A0A1G9BVY9_9FLAO|nr:hypothetical protein [Flavobacterium noncentrifugens]GEP52389.1 hypothetical protein FNO01nite_30610 [Flavobacterium noncentrifugens]SDK43616.1 hypothetical protein SAMN04487935_3375 [Flavobacterium noncentrifugens]